MTYVEGIEGVAQLVAGLKSLDLPSTLYVDGFWDNDIDSVYARFPSQIPTIEIPVGTLWPKPRIRHISINKESLNELKALAKKHAVPELFNNFTAYNENGILIQGYDFPGDEIEVFSAIPRLTLNRFCILAQGKLLEREE